MSAIAFHFPFTDDDPYTKFYWPGDGGGMNWQVWNRPNGKDFLWIFCIGGAAGGGGGFANTAGSGKGGGGGGAASALMRAMYPIGLLPPVLYVNVGPGGAGGAGSASNGAASQAGGDGKLSYVSLYPDSNFVAQNLFAVSGAAAATGGVGGTSTTAAGGTAGTVMTQAGAPMLCYACQFTAVAAFSNGGNGGSGASNNNGGAASVSSASASGMLISGCGGGSSSSNSNGLGGAYGDIANSPWQFSPGAATTVNGDNGFYFPQYPLLWFGGSGGAPSNSVAGTRGGHGLMPGCGGGGGGGGVGTGGNGGDGGGGMVMMMAI